MLNNPSSESQPRAPYTSSWQEEKLGTAGIGKLRLPRQRRKVGQGELDRTAPGLSASESGPVGRGGEREVLPRVKSVTPAAGQTTGEVWRKITRNMGGHMPSRGWAGPGLGEKGGGGQQSAPSPPFTLVPEAISGTQRGGQTTVGGTARHATVPPHPSFPPKAGMPGGKGSSSCRPQTGSQNKRRKELLSQLC